MSPDPSYVKHEGDTYKILKKGTLRKAKSWNKRYFVLKEGSPPRLEYYESENKFKKSNKPKRSIRLEKPWNIAEKRNSQHNYLIVIFTETEYFTMAAENEISQREWIRALRKAVLPEPGVHLFKDVWHVSLDSRHLNNSDSSKHRSSDVIQSLFGPHRLCLTHDKLVFVRTTPSGSIECSKDSVIEMPLTSLRKFGFDADSFFVIFSGRQSGLGDNSDGQVLITPEDEAMTNDIHCRILETTHSLRHNTEPAAYEYDPRNRTSSSGSGSGRRNNPPPSKIGMGKAAPKPTHTPLNDTSTGSFNEKHRHRTASLPAADVINLQDLRMRAGSEGEYSMRRPAKYNRHRARGSMSPAFHSCRSNAMGGYHRRPHGSGMPLSHSHTASLPGSCNSSSFSSTEFINGDHGDYVAAAPSNSSPGHSDMGSSDEYIYGQSPHNLYASGRRYHHRCPTPESKPPPFLSVRYSHHDNYFSMSTPAPPPPNIDPPSLESALAVAASTKRNSVASQSDSHSRTHSFDDSMSCGSSSLSASPYMSTMSNVVLQQNGSATNGGGVVKHVTPPIAMSTTNYSSSSSAVGASMISSSQPSNTNSCSSSLRSSNVASSYNDDYECMELAANQFRSNSKSSQQQRPTSKQSSSPSSSSFIGKIMSVMGSSHSNNHSSTEPDSSVYIPMPLESMECATETPGYVQMRPQTSRPKNIAARRLSNSDKRSQFSNSVSHSSSTYSTSYDSSYASAVSSSKTHYNCQFKLAPSATVAPSSESSTSAGATKQTPVSLVQSSSSVTTSISSSSISSVSKNGTAASQLPPTVKSSATSNNHSSAPDNGNEYLCMNSMLHQLKSSDSVVGLSKSDDPATHTTEGYLPMVPLMNSGNNNNHALSSSRSGFSTLPRSSDCSGCVSSRIRSFSMINQLSKTSSIQYPHQRLVDQDKGSSLERSKKTSRPKSLGFRNSSIGGSAPSAMRRSQSYRKAKILIGQVIPQKSFSQSANNNSSVTQTVSIDNKKSNDLSNGGEYVSIDPERALQQKDSPYVSAVDTTTAREGSASALSCSLKSGEIE